MSYPGHSLGGVLPLCRGAVSVFYSPSWLGKIIFDAIYLCTNKWTLGRLKIMLPTNYSFTNHIYIYIYIYIYMYVCMYVYFPYYLSLWIDLKRIIQVEFSILFTNPSARVGYDTRSIFKRSLTGLNSEFSLSYTSCLTKAEELSLSYYLPIAGGRIIGFIPFLRVLALCEMQSVSSRIWTRVGVSISYDDNHYTTGTSTGRVLINKKKINRYIPL